MDVGNRMPRQVDGAKFCRKHCGPWFPKVGENYRGELGVEEGDR
jgi:hypothetical protein